MKREQWDGMVSSKVLELRGSREDMRKGVPYVWGRRMLRCSEAEKCSEEFVCNK
jgi:hypothetical protein